MWYKILLLLPPQRFMIWLIWSYFFFWSFELRFGFFTTFYMGIWSTFFIHNFYPNATAPLLEVLQWERRKKSIPFTKFTYAISFDFIRSTKDKRKRKDAEDSDFQEILIPELCNLVSYPIAYWIGAIYLPAVLYRVHSLLTADQLRVRIAVMSGIVPVENLRHGLCFREFFFSSSLF
jgi:hypothetical protein